MQQIKKSETNATFRRVFLTMVDDDDVQSRKTGSLSPTVMISKNGAAAVAATNGLTEVDAGDMPGVYYVQLEEAECSDEGTLLIHVSAADCEERELAVQITENGVFGKPSVSVTHWIGQAVATPSVTGVPEVDITHWNGTAVATPTTPGVPRVDVKAMESGVLTATALDSTATDEIVNAVGTDLAGDHGAGSWEDGGGITAIEVADEIVTRTLDANIVSMEPDTLTADAIASNAFELTAFAADALLGIFGILDRGTAQAGGVTEMTLRASASAADGAYADGLVVCLSGAGALQVNQVDSYVGATKVATMKRAWTVNPSNTTTYIILPGPASGSAPSAATVAAAVWGATSEGSHTYGDQMRGIMSVTACRVTDFTSGTLLYKNMAGTTTRITGVVDETGRISVVFNDLT